MIYSIGKKMEKISFLLPAVLKNVHTGRIKLVFVMRCSYQSELLKIEWRNFDYGKNASDMCQGEETSFHFLFVYAVISHDQAPNNIKRNYLREDVSNDTNTTSATIDPIFKSIAILRP